MNQQRYLYDYQYDFAKFKVSIVEKGTVFPSSDDGLEIGMIRSITSVARPHYAHSWGTDGE